MTINEKRLKDEMNAVQQLGDKIGYGNLMSWGSALWRRKLKECGLPENGVFVPRIGELQYDEKIYDEWVNELGE